VIQGNDAVMTDSAKNRKKILIVEDDADTLVLIQHFLKDSGHELFTSRRGDEAFELTLTHQPDLAIIDGLIPGIHGFELCKKIKEEPRLVKKPKVILMSSVYKTQKYKFEVVEFKADAFMVKPFSKSDLLTKVSALLQ
jgi:DNA-binding response OmpR family regulator